MKKDTIAKLAGLYRNGDDKWLCNGPIQDLILIATRGGYTVGPIHESEESKALLAASERERELERKLSIAVEALGKIGCDCGSQYQGDLILDCDNSCHATIAKEALAKIKEGER